jgi:hypothetical protein
MNDMYLIIKIFAYTGIRVVELQKFTVENINKNYIKVFNKGKERTIILRNDLLREIKKYCKDRNITQGYIFRSPIKENQMLDLSTIWRRLKKIARASKINPTKIHPHAWRHLFAKAFMKIQGNSLDELADIITNLPGLRLRGIMIIPPPGDSEYYFAETQELFENKKTRYNLDTLSMGMSADYAEAIKYGSNILRIGSALFGARV